MKHFAAFLVVTFTFGCVLAADQDNKSSGSKRPKLTLKLTEAEHKALITDIKEYMSNYEGGTPPKEVLRAYVINWYLQLRQREVQKYYDLASRVLRPGKGLWTYGRRRRTPGAPSMDMMRPNMGWGKRAPALDEETTYDFPIEF